MAMKLFLGGFLLLSGVTLYAFAFVGRRGRNFPDGKTPLPRAVGVWSILREPARSSYLTGHWQPSSTYKEEAVFTVRLHDLQEMI